MASSDLKKLARTVLNRLESKTFRDRVVNHPGQIFIFDQEQFETTVRSYLATTNISSGEAVKIERELTQLFLSKLQSAEKTAKAKLKKDAQPTLTQIVPSLPNFNPAKHKVFIVTNANTIRRIKNIVGTRLESLTEGKLEKSHVTGQGNKVGFHVGPGEFGTAVSGTRVLAAEAALGKSEGLTEIRQAIVKAKQELGISAEISAERLISSQGRVKIAYTPILSNRLATSSQFDAIGKKNILNAFKSVIKEEISKLDASELGGHPSAKDDIEAFILDKVVPNKAKLKSKVKPKKRVKRASKSGKVKGSKKPKITTNVRTSRGSGIETPKRSRQQTARPPTVNLNSLIPIINQRLPEVVAANMGSPRLNYRTGRFASSARVTDISKTAKGFASIGFTYQKDPYQVFEYPGGSPRLATPQRDPRKIIGTSVREIATGLITGRFYTRRL